MQEYINIAEKKYPIKYGFNALRIFTNITGLKLQDMGTLSTDINLEQAIVLMYAGLKDGARAEKVKFTLEVDDVADLLDQDQEALNKCMEVFARAFEDAGKIAAQK
jgi:hypothetical protein